MRRGPSWPAFCILAVFTAIAIILAVGMSDRQACRSRNETKVLVRSFIDTFGGPEIIKPPPRRDKVLELIEPESCKFLGTF